MVRRRSRPERVRAYWAVVSEREVEIGAVLGGRYRVERVLGRGGMGVVVEATQLGLERRVALKFLKTAPAPDAGKSLTRFEREARTVAHLRGPHVVQVYDVGRLDTGEPFIVMELLNGEDLSALLAREQRLPVATAVDYVLQACEAMAEAHVAGVVHRDLKPANLFLSRGPDGRPLIKVLDFGISKLMAAETTDLNLTIGVVGSPRYMSPEQLGSSKDIDHRTDVWSLGAILYELLVGTPAFDAEALPQLCTRIMLGTAEPMTATAPDVPIELEATILRCLSKAPEDRFSTVADLAMALLPFARQSSHGAAETAMRIVRASTLSHSLPPSVRESQPPARSPSGNPMSSPHTSSAPPSSAGTVNISAPPPALSYVTEAEMSAVSREIYPLLPAQFRDLLPSEVLASPQNAEIFRATLSFNPQRVDELFAQVKYTPGTEWPMWKLVAAFYLVEKRIGPNTVRKAGERIYGTMPWPPEVKSIADALRFTHVAFFESHLRAPVERSGQWRVESEEPGVTILVDETPYPCNVNEGVVAGICVAFSKQNPSYRILDPDRSKRSGGMVTRYEVVYKPA